MRSDLFRATQIPLFPLVVRAIVHLNGSSAILVKLRPGLRALCRGRCGLRRGAVRVAHMMSIVALAWPGAGLASSPHPPVEENCRLLKLLALNLRQFVSMNPIFADLFRCSISILGIRDLNVTICDRFRSRGTGQVISMSMYTVIASAMRLQRAGDRGASGAM